jgi:hypothetical protein
MEATASASSATGTGLGLTPSNRTIVDQLGGDTGTATCQH